MTRPVTPRANITVHRTSCRPESFVPPSVSYHNALERTLIVITQMFALYNLYNGRVVLDLEHLGIYALHSELGVTAGWPMLMERGLLPLIMTTVTALEVVINDFRVVEQCGPDDTADFLAGHLEWGPGTLITVVTLIRLINHAPTEEDLQSSLEFAVNKWLQYRFRHSPELDRVLRIEVDRMVNIIKDCGMPVLHYLDVRDSVRRDLGVNQLDLIAIAIQAAAEAGYESVGDKWIREITVQLSSVGRGILITPTPTPRGIFLGFLGRMVVVNGTSIHGLPTGDRWYAETDVEYCTDAESRLSLLTDFRCGEPHMIRRPVIKHSIREVPRWMTKFLERLVRGKHDGASKAFAEILDVKKADISPDGRESAMVYKRFFDLVADEEGFGRSNMLRGYVSMRSMVRMAVHAQDAKEYSLLLARRIIGTFEVDKLAIRGQTWEMTLDRNEIGLITSEVSGTEVPSDLIDTILKTVHDTQPQDNLEAVPSGSGMVYMWPMTRVDRGAHAAWRSNPEYPFL
eukprot:TRINITY_DN20_c0_g1_i4.p1 TRINITY_DN20_c0_g1~~TRINITY_DN20_c0_g1_i4.p1  ORF type:complete len:514 (-),score=35.90 TRINITY_DN20_c0_g1_i4:161-1702(-)